MDGLERQRPCEQIQGQIMAILDVTESDIMVLCEEKAVTPPARIEITPATVKLTWPGNRADEAQRLFILGEGTYWRFDNDSETQEWMCTVQNGGSLPVSTTAIIERRA